jgi:gliding motility-associated-like protein
MGQLGEGSYHFYIKDNNSCTIDTIVKLVGYPHIVIAAVNVKGVSCFGFTDGVLTIGATGGNPDLTYSVDNSPFSLSNTFTGLASTTHQIQVVDAKGCRKDTSIFLPTPEKLSITPVITNNDCIGLNEEGRIRADVNGGTAPYGYEWSTNPMQTSQEATHLDNGIYLVVVKDANNCSDSARGEITYDDCCTVFIPDAFTPNGDGRNDVVRILYKGDMQLQQFSIYNRFGQRIFYTSNMNDHWDGTFNGQKQDLGTYYYYATVLCGNRKQKIKEFKGDITLIR